MCPSNARIFYSQFQQNESNYLSDNKQKHLELMDSAQTYEGKLSA